MTESPLLDLRIFCRAFEGRPVLRSTVGKINGSCHSRGHSFLAVMTFLSLAKKVIGYSYSSGGRDRDLMLATSR
jgi:hypothetical protein